MNFQTAFNQLMKHEGGYVEYHIAVKYVNDQVI